MASDWLAALLAANQELHLKNVVSYPCFCPRISSVALTPGRYDCNLKLVIFDMEMVSTLLALFAGNILDNGGFLSQRACNAELWCFLCCQLEQAVEQTVESQVIWHAMMPMWHHCNVWSKFHWDIDGLLPLVQERCNSSALAMELRLSCTKTSIWTWYNY